MGVDLPHIEGIVDAKVGVKPSGSSNSTVTFTGPVPVTSGFAVQQIGRHGDSWILQGAVPSANLAFAVSSFGMGPKAAEEPNPLVFDTGDFDCRLEI